MVDANLTETNLCSMRIFPTTKILITNDNLTKTIESGV